MGLIGLGLAAGARAEPCTCIAAGVCSSSSSSSSEKTDDTIAKLSTWQVADYLMLAVLAVPTCGSSDDELLRVVGPCPELGHTTVVDRVRPLLT